MAADVAGLAGLGEGRVAHGCGLRRTPRHQRGQPTCQDCRLTNLAARITFRTIRLFHLTVTD